MDSQRKNDKYRILKANGQAFVHNHEAAAFAAFLKANGVAFTKKQLGAMTAFQKGETPNV